MENQKCCTSLRYRLKDKHLRDRNRYRERKRKNITWRDSTPPHLSRLTLSLRYSCCLICRDCSLCENTVSLKFHMLYWFSWGRWTQGMYFSIEASTFACLELATNFETCFSSSSATTLTMTTTTTTATTAMTTTTTTTTMAPHLGVLFGLRK